MLDREPISQPEFHGACERSDRVAGQIGSFAKSATHNPQSTIRNPKSARLLVIDNYDSFTYNLVQYLGELGADVEVSRNDQMTLDDIAAARPDRIVISPGPGVPSDAGICVPLVKRFAGAVPILGVCLGHQAVAEAFGGRVGAAPTLMHGKTSEILHDGRDLFAGLANPFEATRYHSLVVEPDSVPDCLVIQARTEDGVIMGLRHRVLPAFGVQFHPESIMTSQGLRLLENFLGYPRPRTDAGL